MSQTATEIRNRLGPCPGLPQYRLVSIVVPNRDGAELLRRLLAGLAERTEYPNLELILVDNASSDDSLEFIRSVQAPFPISILANHHNESFADACNQGAETASGELLLFLNNDAEPLEPGWLQELVACLRKPEAGAVGATLVDPPEAGTSAAELRVHSRAVRFTGTREAIARDPGGGRRRLFDEGFGEDIDSTFAIGACILIERTLFQEVGGFTHGYFYGGEDTDLFLKLNTRGLRFLYCGRSVLIHGGSATRSREHSDEEMRSIQGRNSRLLWRRWGARLVREYELDRLAGGGTLAAPGQETSPDAPSPEDALRLGFCLKAGGISDREAPELAELAAELARRGHRYLLLCDDSIDEQRGLDHDVVVHLRGPVRYAPNPAQLNVLWLIGQPAPGVEIECGRYDLVVTADAELAPRLRQSVQGTPVRELGREHPARDLVEAALARAAEIELPTRIDPCPARVV